MSDIIETIDLESKDGFDLKLNILVEHHPIDWIDDDEELRKTYESLERYDTVYFCAQVVASKNSIELASEYLGCCHYESYQDFIDSDDYIADMKDQVMTEAKQVIKSLVI